jgi:hypothetical protein
MPKRVQLPDGTVGEFPDDMEDSAIEGVLQKQFGKPSQAAAQPPSSILQTLQSNFDNNSRAVPSDGSENGGSRVRAWLQNLSGSTARATLGPLVHPMDTFVDNGPVMAAMHPERGSTASPLDGLRSNPGVAIPRLLGTVLPLAIDGMARGGAAAGAESLISPAEVAARATTKAINPPAASAQNMIEALMSQGPDIKNYAAQNNLKLSGVLDYAKIAQKLADETHGQYREMLDPHAQNQVAVPANIYQGKTLARPSLSRPSPSSPREMPDNSGAATATLGDVSNRLTEINKLTNPAYNKPTEAGSDAAISRLGLEHEAGILSDILHRNLGAAAGVAPEDVAALRQRIGKLNTIGDLSNAAVNARSGQEANLSYGTQSVPHGKMSAFAHGVNFIRGGSNAIANRALVKSLNISGQPNLFSGAVTQSISPITRALLAAGASNDGN